MTRPTLLFLPFRPAPAPKNIMNDRRKTIVHRPGLESFRARATIPSDDNDNTIISTTAGIDNARLSTLSQINENDGTSFYEEKDDGTRGLSTTLSEEKDGGIRGLSTTLSDRILHRRQLLCLIKKAVNSGVVANILLGEKQGSGAVASLDDDSELSANEPQTEPKSIIVTSHPRNAGKYTVIAFVNSASGGRMGDEIYKTLQSLLGNEYVIDLHSCGPGNMPEDTLLKYAHDPFVRVLACGGDGTCGWIYSSLDKVWSTILGMKGRVHLSDRFKDHLPLAIMPLGTGNDLSRQYNWGPSFQEHMKQKSMVSAVENADLMGLDRWRCLILPMSKWGEDEKEFIPQILEQRDTTPSDPSERSSLTTMTGLTQMLNDEDEGLKKSNKFVTESNQPSTQYFDGLFCNYFSLGFDATVLYMFHSEREQHPEKFTSPLRNKLVYVEKSPYGIRTPKLKKRIQIFVNNDDGDLVKLKIPKDTRAVILLNIQSYAGGNRFTTKGSPDDGLIEVIFVSNLIRMVASAIAGPVMPFVLFKVRAQTNRVCIRTKCAMHCQVDGEPWLQGEGVIQVKFHTRNAILKKTSAGMNCGCVSGSDNVVVS